MQQGTAPRTATEILPSAFVPQKPIPTPPPQVLEIRAQMAQSASEQRKWPGQGMFYNEKTRTWQNSGRVKVHGRPDSFKR